MGLLEEARAAQQGKRRAGGICGIHKVIEQMDEKDAADLAVAMDDPDIDSATLTTVIKSRGFYLGLETMQRHRRGACSCER